MEFLSEYYSDDHTKKAEVVYSKGEKTFKVNCSKDGHMTYLTQFDSKQQAEDFAEDFVISRG